MNSSVERHFEKLISSESQVEDRYIAVFELKTIASPEAVDYLLKAFKELSK
jgi:HEAT repeat protein